MLSSKAISSCSAVSMWASISPRLPSSSRLLFDPGRLEGAPGRKRAGRLPSRRSPVAAARRGGQGRRRLAPGPDPRAATRRPSWAEHGEHGEDPPLDRSEHRGTHPSQPPVPVVHASSRPTTGKLPDSNYRFVHQSARGHLHQSARGISTKVPVDNSMTHRSSPQCDLAPQGTFTTMPVRPFTGGGLCRSVIPRLSSSMWAARYWLCTSRTV